jgi:hypothetical protein
MLTARHRALRFFYDHAGYSYDARNGETPFQGRWRAAQTLTDAEQRLREGPYYIGIEPDDRPWDGDTPYDGPLWIVDLWEGVYPWDRELLGSIGGVAAEPDDPYLRVVAAELAAEYIPVGD